MKRYILVTDATAEEVEQATGLRGRPTPLGVFVDMPKPFRLEVEMEKLDRALHPRDPRCHCGRSAIMHSPRCPLALIGPS
jgi:hypothetical protein